MDVITAPVPANTKINVPMPPAQAPRHQLVKDIWKGSLMPCLSMDTTHFNKN